MAEQQLKYKDLTDKIIKCAIEVHKKLGPGFVERIYEEALTLLLRRNNIQCARQKEIRINFDNRLIGVQKVDLIIENKVIIELKSVSEINNIHKAQLLSYLKAAEKEVGLILNFAKPVLEIKRIVN